MKRLVGRRIDHPVHGRGTLYYENWRGDVAIFKQERLWRVEYRAKGADSADLVVFVPFGSNPAESQQNWKTAMETDWLGRAATARATANGRSTEVTDEGFSTKYPALFAFLCSCQSDGKPRELCRLQIFAQDGRWKAALHDPNTEHSLFVTLQRAQDAFQVVDKALREEEPDWRAWRAKGAGKGQRKG